MSRKKFLYCVGLGPGNPNWITLQGYKKLSEADIIFLPKGKKTGRSIARDIVEKLNLSNKEYAEVEFPMTKDKLELEKAWDTAAKEMLETISENKTGVFVTLGDPSIYSTAAYLKETIHKLNSGIKMEIIPGVPSFCGAASLAEITLCEGDEKLALIPCGKDEKEVISILKQFDTIIFYKIAKCLDWLIELLKKQGLDENAVLIHKAGFPECRIINDIDSVLNSEEVGYFSMLIVRKRERKNQK